MLAETYLRWLARLECRTRLQAARQTGSQIIAPQWMHTSAYSLVGHPGVQ